MSTETRELESEEGGEFLNVTLRQSDSGGEKLLRTMVFGVKPMILIEPEFDEEADLLTINIDSTDIADLEELAGMFEDLVEIIRGGIVKEKE